MKIVAAPLVAVCCALLLPACASGGGGEPAPRPAAATASADTAHVYDISEATVKPQLANRSAVARALEQHYPGPLRDAGAQGSVTIRMIVERDGRTSSVTVLRSNHAQFNDAAVNVARVMRFSPAQVNGVPVRVRIDLPISFMPQR
jgi:protein TonB